MISYGDIFCKFVAQINAWHLRKIQLIFIEQMRQFPVPYFPVDVQRPGHRVADEGGLGARSDDERVEVSRRFPSALAEVFLNRRFQHDFPIPRFLH